MSPQGAPAQKPAIRPSLQRLDHARRRRDDERVVALGERAGRREPVAQEGDCEWNIRARPPEFCRPRTLELRRERGGVADFARLVAKRYGKVFGERDRVAAEAHAIGNDQRLGGSAQAERDREGERRNDHRRVERAIGQLVGDVGPGRLDRQRDVEALVGEKAELVGDDRRRRIGQPQQADRDFPAGHGAGGDSVTHLSSPSASWSLMRSAATSAIRRLSFIALLRSQR